MIYFSFRFYGDVVPNKDTVFQQQRIIFDGNDAVERDEDVVRDAREIGNNVQSAPSKAHYEQMLAQLGFQAPVYLDANVVEADAGFKHTYKAPVVDTTAAGDTMLGFFTGLLSKGYSPADALCVASKASSITVSGKGAAASIPTLADALSCPYEYVEFKE